jgi:ribose/xylose/arabinose/galactoside ABC-type transport system permease subunit
VIQIAAQEGTGMNSRQAGALRRFGLWLVLVLVTLGLMIASPTFRQPANFENILDQSAILGIVACGMAVMMISGGFDLSVGATGATASVVAAVVSETHGTVLTVLAAIGIGLLIGVVNGLLISRVRINAFVATFAMASVVGGLLLVATRAESKDGGTSIIRGAASGRAGGLPVIFLIFIGCLGAVWFLLTRTKYGHYIYSVGGNAEASHLSGVPVQRVQVFAFALGGFFAAGAGVLLLGQTNLAQPGSNSTGAWPLQAIAICVVGGVALTGGVGRIEDVLAATLLLGVIRTGLNHLGISPDWQDTVTGIVILIAVVFDQYSRLHKGRRTTEAAMPTKDSSAPPRHDVAQLNHPVHH